jgi:hypothetical protein
MLNSQLPASKYLVKSIDPVKIPVLSQEANLVTVPLSKTYSLILGSLVDFDGVIGYVSAVTATTAIVNIFTKQRVTFGTLKPLFKYETVPTQIIYLPVGSFRAFCTFPDSHRAGLMGWSIFEGNTQRLLAVGNDYIDKGVCSLSGKVWQPGTYRLEVTRFNSENSPQSFATKFWSCSQPTNQFTAGAFNDADPIIYLR